MTTPIVFPDIELWATTYLRSVLPSYGYTLWTAASPGDEKVFVSNKRETQKTAVWVRRDGGQALDVVREAPRLSVNVFATSDKKATDLALRVSALLRSAPDGAPVLKVEQMLGPSPIADASGPHMFMTFELQVRGSALLPTP
jgi:hypothetical protein